MPGSSRRALEVEKKDFPCPPLGCAANVLPGQICAANVLPWQKALKGLECLLESAIGL